MPLTFPLLSRSWLVGAALAITTGRAVHSQSLPDTLDLRLQDVRDLTLSRNPSFLAARQETAIALAERRQARTYPFNPEVAALLPGIPSAGAPRYELSLTQELEWAGQRGLRTGAADYGVTRAAAVVRDAARQTLGGASIAFFRAVAARARLAVSEQALALSERLVGAVRIQVREGEISILEANLAEIEAGRARGRVLASRREATSAELALKQSIGLAPDLPIRVHTDTSIPSARALSVDSLIQVALARRPDVTASVSATRQSETLAALARREAIPNLRVGAVAERDNPGEDPRIGFAIGMGLPLLNRNRGLVERRRAETVRLELQTRATELAVRTEVTDAVRAYETAVAEASIYETSVLLPARRNVALLDSAYRAGKLPLPTLLLLRNQLLDAELNYWEAWFALREAVVRLELATASLTFELPAPSSLPARTRP